MQTIYHLSLVGHITGLTMMAGTTLVDFLLFQQFWKQYAIEPSRGIALRQAMLKLPVLFGLGIILLVISGVSMMAITHGVFGEQTWFRIKIALVALVIVNGLAIGRRQGLKLGKILSEEASAPDMGGRLLKVKNNLRRFHFTQLVMFLIIFTLSVFKFN